MTRGKLLPFPGVRRPGGVEPLSDEALVAACALDGDALGQLFDRHHTVVHRFLARYLPLDEAARDDLVQQTFLAVRQAAPAFAGSSTVRTWLLGIAANVARHDLRSRTRRTALSEAVSMLPRQTAPRPDEASERNELLARLQVAVLALSPKLRVVFLMCDVEGIPGVEVARGLGLREGTLWRRLHEARRRLRAALEGGT